MKKITILLGVLLATFVNMNADDEYLIRENGVGLFFIESKIPVQADGYTINKEVIIKESEEGPYEIPVYSVTDGDGLVILEIDPAYDYDSGGYTDVIGEINIFSDEYKTEEGVGVNSTIKDFMKVYPDYTIWYTYISGIYVIETEQIGVQFLLDEADYIGKEIEIEGDMNILKASDFKEETKIKSIRVF